MRRLLAFLLASLLVIAPAPGVIVFDFVSAAAGGSYLLSEDFEGSGTPSGWTTSGTVSFDYTTSPAPFVGAESLAVSSVGGYARSDSFSADQNEVWVFVRVKPGAGVNGGVVSLLNSSNAAQCTLDFRSDRVRVEHGVGSLTSLGASTTSETTFWLRYVAEAPAGSGANGIVQLYINKNSNSETRPALTASISNGTGDAVRKVQLGMPAAGSGVYIFDKVRVSAAEIGSSPL